MTIRLLLADDQELVRSALCALLELEEDFDVVAPGLDGLAAAAVLRSQVPACRAVILTTFGRAGYLRRAKEAGAAGFVVKDAPSEVLASAIRRVMDGELVVDPALAAATLAAGESPLTARERDVLTVARAGATVAEIAAKLYLSEGTVRNYLSSAIAKTSARNRLDALRTADERGWL